MFHFLPGSAFSLFGAFLQGPSPKPGTTPVPPGQTGANKLIYHLPYDKIINTYMRAYGPCAMELPQQRCLQRKT